MKAATIVWASERLMASDYRYGGTGIIVQEDEADALGIATACAMLTEKREAA